MPSVIVRAVHELQYLENKKNAKYISKKYVKAEESDFNIISFIYFADKVSLNNLPPDLS